MRIVRVNPELWKSKLFISTVAMWSLLAPGVTIIEIAEQHNALSAVNDHLILPPSHLSSLQIFARKLQTFIVATVIGVWCEQTHKHGQQSTLLCH